MCVVLRHDRNEERMDVYISCMDHLANVVCFQPNKKRRRSGDRDFTFKLYYDEYES